MLGPSEEEVESTITEQLLVHGLQKMYHAEQELDDALWTLAEQTEDETAKEAFSEHREETREHVERLEQVFEEIGADAQTREETVVRARIDEHESFAQDNEGEVLDRYNLAVAQKTEHYEIAAYGNLRRSPRRPATTRPPTSCHRPSTRRNRPSTRSPRPASSSTSSRSLATEAATSCFGSSPPRSEACDTRGAD